MKSTKWLEPVKNNIWLILICACGAFLRFYKLGQLIFYWDEPAHTVKFAANPLSHILTYDYGSIPYQILTHFLMPLGKLEFFSRLPAALFGILTILVVYFLGKMFFGKSIGQIAAVLTCFSYYMLRYSQYARAYTALTLFSLLSLYFFYRALEENSIKHWALFFASTVTGIYFHLFMLITVLPYIAFVGLITAARWTFPNTKQSWQIGKKRLINFSLSMLCVFVCVFLLRMSVQIQHSATQNWIVDTIARFKEPPTIRFFPLIKSIFNHHIYPSPSLIHTLALVFILCGILGCLIRLRKKDILFLLFLIVPLAAFVLVRPQEIFSRSPHRYFIFLLPLLLIAAARGMVLVGTLLASLSSRLITSTTGKAALRNGFTGVLILCFLVLEIGVLLEYSASSWRLFSIKMDQSIHSFLKGRVEEEEMFFLDSYPNKAEMLMLSPLYLNRRKKDLFVKYYNKAYFLQVSRTKNYGLWVVFDDHSILEKRDRLPGSFFAGAEIFSVDGKSVIHWKAGQKTLLNAWMETVRFLIPLHPESEAEYRLLLTKLHLADKNLHAALKELEAIGLNKFPALRDPENEKNNRPWQQAIDTFKIGRKNSHLAVQKTLYADIGHLLFELGDEFLAEGRVGDAVTAFDACTQILEDTHEPAAIRWAALGNQNLRQGRIDEALAYLDRAINLFPQNSFYRLIRAEAYWRKGMKDASIEEFRQALHSPSLPEEVIRRLVSKNRLFALWRAGGRWCFLWRSDESCRFAGNIYFDSNIRLLQPYHFSKRDELDQYKDYALEFNVHTNNRSMKYLELDIRKKSRLTCFVKVNDQINTEDILFIPSGENPKEMPFFLSSSSSGRLER